MKYRYVTIRPNSKWDEDVPLLPALNVYEPEDKPIETGLLDSNGTKLYRVRERIKMGFG